ncbi:hypothetical protein TanjilG_01426 [Lupinus angustifolius]|uniref:lamin-like protein n=1 Tax=Lupinus angustifolius TaxID=3871 RepID=UPI00090DF5BF|nr:PREDICTED: lamin-like protein [Lupinus angustifolius]OIV90230.1 hypothetical protein TanjilG_01426 [Lupinus angustifolius]
MENLRVDNKMMVMVMVIIGLLALYPLMVMADPIRHKVGGNKGWSPNVNYTEWSSHEHFLVGDWLWFIFDKHYYNILEVNKTSYENCIDNGFIKNLTRGGRDVVELKEARTYYYISSGGYCFHQMKVAVNVEEHQAPITASPPPIMNNSGSILPYVYTCTLIIVANVLFMILVSIGAL